MNRIFVTGDTHGTDGLKRFSSKKFPENKKLTKDDYVVILGDFGVVWKPFQSDKEEVFNLKFLDNKNFTTLVVAGNHENFDRLNKLEETHNPFINGPVKIISGKVFLLKRGEIYNIGGKKVLVVDGATSYDKHLRTEFLSWWKNEEWSHEEQENCLKRLEEHQYHVDYIFAHTLPLSIVTKLGWVDRYYPIKQCSVSKFLDHIIENVQFKEFYCGHWHCNKDYEKYHILYEKIMEIK